MEKYRDIKEIYYIERERYRNLTCIQKRKRIKQTNNKEF